MMKNFRKIGYVCLSIFILLTGIVLLGQVETVPVTVQCVEVAFSSSRSGTLYRHHYMRYPNGKIKTIEGSYYQQGKYYTIHDVKNSDTEAAGLICIAFGSIFLFFSIFHAFVDD